MAPRDPHPTDYASFKALMLKQTGGDEKRGRARALFYGILWNLEPPPTPISLIDDCLELLRFEAARLLAEGQL